MPTIPGIMIKNSKDLLTKDTMLLWLLWAASGYGKTRLAGQLDEFCKKYMGKRALVIACEENETGGAATIRDMGVPVYVPKDHTELEKTARWLRNDATIGGVIFDSATEGYKKHIKPVTLRYPCRENVATRAAGVLTRSDYQVAGELTSQLFRLFVQLTTLTSGKDKNGNDIPSPNRKHVIVTAADLTREEDGKTVWVGPDLPGRMGREAVQMFDQVGTLNIRPKVVDGKRTNQRFLSFEGTGVQALKDRWKMFPPEMMIRPDVGKGDGEDLISLYEKYWLPALKEAE